MAPIRPLTQELPYAVGAALKRLFNSEQVSGINVATQLYKVAETETEGSLFLPPGHLI